MKSIKRFYSKKGTPQFVAFYEYESFEDLKKSLASEESRLAGRDFDRQIGKLVKFVTYITYTQIYPK